MNKNYITEKFNYLVPLKVDLIRVGMNMDGGYVLGKNELNKIKYLISLEIGSERNNFRGNNLLKNKSYFLIPITCNWSPLIKSSTFSMISGIRLKAHKILKFNISKRKVKGNLIILLKSFFKITKEVSFTRYG